MPKIIKNGIEYAGNDNLSNYYTKDETYSKVEVDALIGSFANFEVVEELPTTDISTSTIYLVPKSTAGQDNIYDEYINTDGTSAGWELIGDTDVDLSNYYNKTETDNLLSAKANSSDIKNGTLTIKHNGTTKQTFTANQSTNADADIEAVDWKANSLLGAKNLNSYPYNATSGTTGNVTFTDNKDGTIKATGRSTSQTRTGFSCHSRTIGSNNPLFLKNGTYKLTGCPSGGSETSYYIEVGRTSNGGNSAYGRETGDGLVFTVDGDDNNADKAQIQLFCYCYSQYQLPQDGIIFKPMIRLVSDTDEEWQPYVLTNKELSDKKADKWQDLGNWNTTSVGSSMSYSDKYDEFLIRIVGTTYSLDVHILNIAGVITGASGRIYRNYYQSDSQNYMAVNVGLTFGIDTIIFALETGTEEVINGSSQSIQQIITFAR